jgi:TetR/AcrR family transcriptional regulator, tetracycline repressor protein
MALAPDHIVEVALKLLNRIGLDALSTRRLAEELDVKGPSLYHHFRNKADLLGQMAVVMLARCLAELDLSVGWEDWIRNLAHGSRKMMHQYRDGARIMAVSSPAEAMRKNLIPILEQPLLRAGFSVHQANEAIGLMSSFVIGWTSNEQNQSMRRYMDSMLDVDESFDFAIETIVLGLKQQVASGRMKLKVTPPSRAPARKSRLTPARGAKRSSAARRLRAS